jgi:hypothetical protein
MDDRSPPADYPPPSEPPAGSVPAAGGGGAYSPDERLWGMLTHLSGLVVALLSVGMLGFVGPLILWLVKREESGFLDDQGREALNFQLTMTVGYAVLGALALATCGVLLPLLAVPPVLQIVFGIVAAIKSHDGQLYRYPLNIRFLK